MPKITVSETPIVAPVTSTAAVEARQALYDGILQGIVEKMPAAINLEPDTGETLRMLRNNLSRAASRANVELLFVYAGRREGKAPIAMPNDKGADFLQVTAIKVPEAVQEADSSEESGDAPQDTDSEDAPQDAPQDADSEDVDSEENVQDAPRRNRRK